MSNSVVASLPKHTLAIWCSNFFVLRPNKKGFVPSANHSGCGKGNSGTTIAFTRFIGTACATILKLRGHR